MTIAHIIIGHETDILSYIVQFHPFVDRIHSRLMLHEWDYNNKIYRFSSLLFNETDYQFWWKFFQLQNDIENRSFLILSYVKHGILPDALRIDISHS